MPQLILYHGTSAETAELDADGRIDEEQTAAALEVCDLKPVQTEAQAIALLAELADDADNAWAELDPRPVDERQGGSGVDGGGVEAEEA